MAAATKKRRRRRRARAVLVRRWLGVGALCLIALLYYRPLRTYVETHRALVHRDADVRALEQKRHALERQLSETRTPAALVREARKLGYVKPGERLFIVKGIEAWERAQRTIRRDGR